MANKDHEQKKRECWEEYCETHPLCNTPVMRLNFDWTFDRAYILGKQGMEVVEMIRMQGWMCRDKIWDKELQDSDLCVAMEKPERDQEMGCWVYMGYFIPLKTELYPDLTWDDEPVEVEILVNKIM